MINYVLALITSLVLSSNGYNIAEYNSLVLINVSQAPATLLLAAAHPSGNFLEINDF